MTYVLLLLIILALILLFSQFRIENLENLYAPIDDTPIERSSSVMDYYGAYDDYLMDKIAKTGSQYAIPQEPAEIYCDRPNRNRSFLVNPLLTQKQIFIKPDVNAYKSEYPYDPDWGNSAQGIRIGSESENDAIALAEGENIFYSNFGKIAKEFNNDNINPVAYMDSYRYRCGLDNCGDGKLPLNTLNNPY